MYVYTYILRPKTNPPILASRTKDLIICKKNVKKLLLRPKTNQPIPASRTKDFIILRPDFFYFMRELTQGPPCNDLKKKNRSNHNIFLQIFYDAYIRIYVGMCIRMYA